MAKLQTYPLVPHPDHIPRSIRTIEARVLGHDANWLRLRWRIEGAGDLVVPPFAGKGRAEGLWKTTCLEAFLRPAGSEAYVELNLSPSERWAAYDFSGYRDGMAERPFPREPDCTMRAGTDVAIFDAAIPAAGLPSGPCQLGLSAVIEEKDGTKSYWALAHPPGKPDFHHPDCFALELPAPEAS